MKSKIIYQMTNCPVSILTPCECGLSLEEIGGKDVPAGLPFWIVSSDFIPDDRTMRDAWEIDPIEMGEPSGVGGGE